MSCSGFFAAVMTAAHTPASCAPPVALLSITGIATFRHPFFNSSTLIPPDPITEEEVEKFITEPVTVGRRADYGFFSLSKLLPSGARNPEFQASSVAPKIDPGTMGANRGLLYDYYVYQNMYEALVGSVDDGFDWAKDPAQKSKLEAWPMTIFIQGTADDDVDMDVSVSSAAKLGDRAIIHLVDAGHLYESDSYVEDAGPKMDTVRKAVDDLDKVVAAIREVKR
jgi:hypothetical protein